MNYYRRLDDSLESLKDRIESVLSEEYDKYPSNWRKNICYNLSWNKIRYLNIDESVVNIALSVVDNGVKSYEDFIEKFSKEVIFLNNYGLTKDRVEAELVDKFWYCLFDYRGVAKGFDKFYWEAHWFNQMVTFGKYSLNHMPLYMRICNNSKMIPVFILISMIFVIRNISDPYDSEMSFFPGGLFLFFQVFTAFFVYIDIYSFTERVNLLLLAALSPCVCFCIEMFCVDTYVFLSYLPTMKYVLLNSLWFLVLLPINICYNKKLVKVNDKFFQERFSN